MKQTKAMKSSRPAWPCAWRLRHRLLAAAFMLLFLICGLPVHSADGAQPGRFLFIFENSPVLKKNLPVVRDTIAALFANNLQKEIRADDDVAVWTVDDTLHTGLYPLASWTPDEAAAAAARLSEFLRKQHYTRHASLTNLQPLLNRVVHNSDRLTVLIFCDSQSRLSGTPYDSGVNEIITNATARLNGNSVPFILVLRAYQGQYLGCSVNRSGTLNFPPFPPPPAPEPPPVVTPAPPPAPLVKPVPALVIVGTKAGTNVSLLATAPARPVTELAATNVAAATTPMSNPPPPVAAPEATGASPASAPAPIAASNAAVANEKRPPTDMGSLLTPVLTGGVVVATLALIIGLIIRARRPHSSLITSSMQDDPRHPKK